MGVNRTVLRSTTTEVLLLLTVQKPIVYSLAKKQKIPKCMTDYLRIEIGYCCSTSSIRRLNIGRSNGSSFIYCIDLE